MISEASLDNIYEDFDLVAWLVCDENFFTIEIYVYLGIFRKLH